MPEEPKLNEVHFGFTFLGKEDEPGKLTPMLVIRERISGMTMASTMPTKSAGTFITSRIIALLTKIDCEFGALLPKSDQEPAVMAIVQRVARVRGEVSSSSRTAPWDHTQVMELLSVLSVSGGSDESHVGRIGSKVET